MLEVAQRFPSSLELSRCFCLAEAVVGLGGLLPYLTGHFAVIVLAVGSWCPEEMLPWEQLFCLHSFLNISSSTFSWWWERGSCCQRGCSALRLLWPSGGQTSAPFSSGLGLGSRDKGA